MNTMLTRYGYVFDEHRKIWHRADFYGIAYSDGDEVELRIAKIIDEADDISVLSTELRQHCTDWPSLYHLSGQRANILRPFEEQLKGDILEIGAGCGAITRFLGECGGNILALEGSPRRASIARSRTRDLKNVCVVAEQLDSFECDQKFDIVTLIGVLEYANLFTKTDTPALSLLERARSLLKPEGRLIIAIENQLGLKYFAGAAEDHLGQPMYGIEARYRNDQPQTFGRKVLTNLLAQAGFSSTEFYAPYPDYKLPSSVITERGFLTEEFDAAALAWQSVRRDPQLPSVLAFSPELVWPTLFKNSLALDLANSFLIVARSKSQENETSKILAWHFTTDRKIDFCKETRFLRDDNGAISVQYQVIKEPIENTNENNQIISFSIPEKADYVIGHPLSLELLQTITRDNWKPEDIAHVLEKYLNIIICIGHKEDIKLSPNGADTILPGRFFDYLPQNIIVSPGNKFTIIDQEWDLHQKISAGFLIFRTLWSLVHTVTRLGKCAVTFDSTPICFINKVFSAMNWRISDKEIYRYFEIEANIQSAVSGRPIDTTSFIEASTSALRASVNLGQAAETLSYEVATLTQGVAERDLHITRLDQVIAERDLHITRLDQIIAEKDSLIASLSTQLATANALFERIISSKSWQLTKPLRFFGRTLRGEFKTALMPLKRLGTDSKNDFIRKITIATAHILSGDLTGLIQRAKESRAFRRKTEAQMRIEPKKEIQNWGILTSKHTLFIAHLIAERLSAHGFTIETMTCPPSEFKHDMYIVICPQIFSSLPPGEKRIAFQLEQSVSSRWFTSEYFHILEKSLSVFDYSLSNIKNIAKKGIAYPHVHYLPIGASNSYGQKIAASHNKHDLLFYGDSLSSPRRRLMLDALQKRFSVQVVNDIFGDDMVRILKSARVVVNIHYYENALLETPRIQECLSLGLKVVSESAQDQNDYPELLQAIQFFEEGSIEGMISAVEQALDSEENSCIQASVKASKERFAFMLDRALISIGILPTMQVTNLELPLPNNATIFGLSLPETISRRSIFEAIRPNNCVIFDGIRRRPGWVGCGLSYAALARHALNNGVRSITVMEDDVILPEDYPEAIAVINAYLDKNAGEWDVFVGVIAALHPDTNILNVEHFAGRTFVTIDRMTSMVFNIYAESTLRRFLEWNPDNLNAEFNTIDRYLESQKRLRVIVMMPYFVGHREEVNSTLWGFNNSQYREMISESESALKNKVADFIAQRGLVVKANKRIDIGK